MRLFRFFDQMRYAEAFIEGNVRLSTIKKCRAYEDAEQGDSGEASTNYSVTNTTGSPGDPTFDRITQNLGNFRFGPNARNITFENVSLQTMMPDAFILCLTKHAKRTVFKDNFGEHCVEIIDTGRFFLGLKEALKDSLGENILGLARGDVRYSGREYRDLEDHPGHPYFVKPNRYCKQDEYRVACFVRPNLTIEPTIFSIEKKFMHCRMAKI